VSFSSRSFFFGTFVGGGFLPRLGGGFEGSGVGSAVFLMVRFHVSDPTRCHLFIGIEKNDLDCIREEVPRRPPQYELEGGFEGGKWTIQGAEG